jgi:hypothetical protein
VSVDLAYRLFNSAGFTAEVVIVEQGNVMVMYDEMERDPEGRACCPSVLTPYGRVHREMSISETTGQGVSCHLRNPKF